MKFDGDGDGDGDGDDAMSSSIGADFIVTKRTLHNHTNKLSRVKKVKISWNQYPPR